MIQYLNIEMVHLQEHTVVLLELLGLLRELRDVVGDGLQLLLKLLKLVGVSITRTLNRR